MYLEFEEYPSHWQELIDLLSPEAVEQGSIDKLIASRKVQKGTVEVDAAFLQEIERWRLNLARSMARHNPELDQRTLNYTVQLTIDRILFLRICEDRGAEPYGLLQGLKQGPNVYQRLLLMFRQADDRYNSGLFHFRSETGRNDTPDTITPKLIIDDTVLHDIFENLYYPDSPYEFSVFPADALGQVYEQFLGKVICLTTARQVTIEEKPEEKNAYGDLRKAKTS